MPDPLRILIVEDEFLTLNDLRSALERMGYAISGDAMRADEALAVLEEGQTDLAILDIHIKGARSGIWLAEQIRERYNIPFIFLTAFSDKATIADAARTLPESYLIKPFVREDLFAAIELAVHTFASRNYLSPSSYPASQPPPAPAAAPPEQENERKKLLLTDSIFVKSELVFSRITVADIRYLQSFRNYLELHVASGKKYVLRSTLRDFMDQLPGEVFLQTHRSFAINLQRINHIGGNFVKVDDDEVPLSRDIRQEVVRRLNTFQ